MSLRAVPRSGFLSWRAEARGDSLLSLHPGDSAWRTNTGLGCFKNKQPDLDLFLHFREAGKQVSFENQRPFVQWHF